MHWDGRTRTFLLHLPPEAASGAPLPLVVVLHGSGANANTIMDESGLNSRADSAGYAVVYPNGTGWLRYFVLTWNASGCCGEALAHDVDDIGFIGALIRRVTAAMPIDTMRIYATGFSDGARLVYHLGCDLPGVFAGIAPVSGGITDTTCHPAHPISVDIFHGTADRLIPYGAGTVPRRRFFALRRGRPLERPSSAPETFVFWAQRDSCPSIPSRTVRGTVVTEAYEGCAEGTEVELHSIRGGRHAWPGGRRGWFLGPEPSRDIDASSEMLQFFSRHRRQP